MEILENKKTESNEPEVLVNRIIETIKNIDEFVKHNEYRFVDEPDFSRESLYGYNYSNVKEEIYKMTLNQRKSLKRKINAFNKRPSIASVNKFYHHLLAWVLESTARIKIAPSEKEVAIQKKRKEYVQKRNEMLAALKEYKEEKGDFYKLRLAKGQKA